MNKHRKFYKPLKFDGIKFCPKCKIYKEFYEFSSNKSEGRDGLQTYCKNCIKIVANEYRNRPSTRIKIKQYRDDNKDRMSARMKIWYEGNKEEVLCKCKEYRNNHKEEYKARMKKWYEDNKKEVSIRSKMYRDNNKDKILAKIKKYYEDNKEEVLRKNKIYRENHREERNIKDQNKRNTNIQYRMSCNLRKRFLKALRNNYKSGSAVRDLGCSIEYFVNIYIPSKFYSSPETGKMMTWDNYGTEWQLHHIKPLHTFDLTDKKQLLKACRYTNMVPLWLEDHVKAHMIRYNKVA